MFLDFHKTKIHQIDFLLHYNYQWDMLGVSSIRGKTIFLRVNLCANNQISRQKSPWGLAQTLNEKGGRLRIASSSEGNNRILLRPCLTFFIRFTISELILPEK